MTGEAGRRRSCGFQVTEGRAVLQRADDHGVNPVKSDRKHHPEDRGEEQAANDLADGVGLEEAGGTTRTLVGEALVSGLYGWERWCLHCSTSIGKDESRVRGSFQAIPQRDYLVTRLG